MIYKHPNEIPKSKLITGIKWIGERMECPIPGIHGDTYPMTWAADDEIYMSSGDPNWAFFDGIPRHVKWDEAIENPGLYPHMGGLDIEKLTGSGSDFGIEQINTMPGLMGPGGLGAKPSGIISVNGSLYIAVQNLLGYKQAPHSKNSQHGSDATILKSDDFGKTWRPDIQTDLIELEARFYDRKSWKWLNPPEERQSWKGWTPMFPGAAFGGPSFIQYGRDNSDALDDYIYAISGDQWDNGSELRLGRVHKSSILERDTWKWAVTEGDGCVKWVESLGEAKPVLTIEKHLGLPEMIYLPSIKRYLMLTWGLHKDFSTEAGSELIILESEHPWGPFRLVHYEEIWESIEVCPYCPRIPMKWFNDRELSGWLLHSGNWWGTEHYKAQVRPFELLIK